MSGSAPPTDRLRSSRVSRRATRLLLAAVLASTAACRMPESARGSTVETVPESPSADPVKLGSTTLGPGDVVEVRVYGEDLSGAHRVSPEGTIDFPLCGRVE